MYDVTLQKVWNAREAISRKCDFDAQKLVRFYQSRQKLNSTSRLKQQSSHRDGDLMCASPSN